MSERILALDIGSSSVRAAVCDRFAAAIPGTFTQIAAQFERTPDGGATLDPESVCALIFDCIDQTLAKAGPEAITRVTIDTFVTSLVGVDARGTPATPLYTWADARGSGLIPALRRQLDGEAYRQRTGAYVHPSYWPLRLAWLRGDTPERFAAVRCWLTLGAYLMRRLFGANRISISDASWTGQIGRAHV